jgi:hypothetical protein
MKQVYCCDCGKFTNHIPKLDALKDGKMVCDECSRLNSYCVLFKVDDKNFVRTSGIVKFLEWNLSDGSFKEEHNKPNIDFSLIMGPLRDGHAWLTTTITEIIEEKDNYLKFKTKNSFYELFHVEPYNPDKNE